MPAHQRTNERRHGVVLLPAGPGRPQGGRPGPTLPHRKEVTTSGQQHPTVPGPCVVSWLMLTGAIAAEVTATAVLRHATTSLPVAAAVILLYTASYGCLALAVRGLDLAVAYAVWCAVGIAAIATVGAVAYHEPLSPPRLLALALVAGAVTILALTPRTPHHPARHTQHTTTPTTIHTGAADVRTIPSRNKVAGAAHAPRHAR